MKPATHRIRIARTAAWVMLPVFGGAALAATTEISTAPLFTASGINIKPNIMFILDDSGSMARAYIPDVANFDNDKYGGKASQCNGMAYNPGVVYIPPVNYLGVSLGDADQSILTANPTTQTDNPRSLSGSITMPATATGTLSVTVNASNRKDEWFITGDKATVYQNGDATRWISGYVQSWNKSSGALVLKLTGGQVQGTGTLTSARAANDWVNTGEYYTYTGAQQKLSYTYDSAGAVITSTTFYKECNSDTGASPGSGVFTLNIINQFSPAAAKKNYANWYAYYRTRMNMMKTATSLAFKGIDTKFRIGYSTINEERAKEDDADKAFLHIRDFNATQKSKFYQYFNAATPGPTTPLRGALAKAGQYYGNKAYLQDSDPIQFSCQRNFSLLSTDGYWNTGDEKSSSPKYGPYRLDNSTLVGNQDGSGTLRPMYDGGGATSSSSSLADVAMYYYKTDLRDSALSNCTGANGSDVCLNNVPGTSGDAHHSYGDNATHQHMTTFTLGMGLSGRLKYDPNYTTQVAGDFYDIVTGAKNWPLPSDSSARPENLDDLWHAAVNGRGEFFSASDPATLLSSLTTALNKIDAKVGSASAASTSSLHPVQGDNDVYVAQFTTQKWIGDLLAYTIDPDSGAISVTPTWSAAQQLALKTAASRTIYYRKPDGSQTPRPFTWANLTTDSLTGHFSNFCTKTSASGAGSPEQCIFLTDQTAANNGSNLVNYLRGDQSLTYYREREGVLGDIINASPLFVGKPSFLYTENNYAAFASANANRQGIVLAAANDGMVHAFKRQTGEELWSFIPTAVMPNLYKLADSAFTNNHSYFVDGSMQLGDIWTGTAWKTIAVGGLNSGGRSYYALDVTDPLNPKILWEFTHNDLGLSFGNPIITKRADGTWVVVFGSGYNNVSPGDGNGHLFVLNANTGALIKKVSTMVAGAPVGSTGTPSGLAKVNVWVDTDTDNAGRRYYGGDLLGNLWRFDIDNLVAPNDSAMRLAQLTNTAGGAQPVTSMPALAEVVYNGQKFPVVYAATGRYLGTADLTDTTVQTLYAIKDPMSNSPWGVVRGNSNFVVQTFTVGANGKRSVTSNPVDWTTKAGWRADLPVAGERVNINPQLVLNTLIVGSNLPSNDACAVGGSSYIYNLDISTGSTAPGETDAGYGVGDVLVQGLTVVQLKDGSTETIITRSDAKLQVEKNPPVLLPAPAKRTSWRELVD